MAAPDGSFWSDIGPYLLMALGALVIGAYADLKRDNRWLRRNLTNVLIQLSLKAED